MIMRISARCPACLLNRVYIESKLATIDERLIERAIEVALKILSDEFPKKMINTVIATKLHKKVYEVLRCEDPYKEFKMKANKVAMNFLPFVERFISKQGDRFRAAVIASIIGNNFDYGVMGHEVHEIIEDLRNYFLRMFEKGLAVDDVDEIKKLISGRVVYITDNAGEIFFDKLLIREIKKNNERLSVVAREKPIISDATIEDVKLAGINEIADEILSNGSTIGIIEDELPETTLQRFEEADLIIAKGMGNYECLSESRFVVAFLLTAKCEPVAKNIGVEVGDMVAMLKWR